MSVSNILIRTGVNAGKINPALIVGGGAGVVDSVVGSSSINVNNADPVNPVVNIAFTASQDLMVGTGANAGAVLGVGANGTYLGVNNAGVLAYSNPPQQGVPFNAEGQMLYAGVAPGFADTLLNVGNAGQVLGVANGVPAWTDTGGSGLITANLPLIEEADPAPNSKISINFTATVGEIPYGTGVAKVGALTVAPNPASSNQFLGTVAGVPTWKNMGGSSITAIPPLVELVGVGDESQIGIGFSNAVVGQIPYGDGTLNTGALTNAPTAGQILGVNAGVPAWINAGGSGTITGTFPIVESAGGTNESNIALGFANKGELVCGAGGATAGAGVILPPATADGYVLESFASAPAGMRWVANTPAGNTQSIIRSKTDTTAVPDPQTIQDTLILVAENPANSWDLQQDPVSPGTPITPYAIEAESAGIVNIDTVACSCVCVPQIINNQRAVQLYILTNTEQISVGTFYQGTYITPSLVSGILNPLSAPASTLLQNSFIVYGSFQGFHYTAEAPDVVCNGIAVIDCSQLSADVIVVRPLAGGMIGIPPGTTLIGVSNTGQGVNTNPVVWKMLQSAEKLYHFGFFDSYDAGGDGSNNPDEFNSIGIFDLNANNYYDTIQLRALGLGVGLNALTPGGIPIPGEVYDAYGGFGGVSVVGYWEQVLQTNGLFTAVSAGMTGFGNCVFGSGVNTWSSTPTIAGGFQYGYCLRQSFSSLNPADNLIMVGVAPNTPIFYNITANTLTATTGAIPAFPQQGWINSITGSASIDIGFGVNAYDLVMYQDKTSGDLFVVYFANATGLVAQPLTPTPTGLKPLFIQAPFPPTYVGPYTGFPNYGINIITTPSPAVYVVATGGLYKYDPASHSNLDFTGNFYYNGALKNTARFSTANLGNESQAFVASTSLKAWIQTGAKTDGLTYLP
jgi:hypothetical protein